MATLSDTSVTNLLARARGGDDRDVNRLFERCRAYLRVVAQAQVESWLRAKVDPSDIVQQTLIEAHRDFARFRGANEAEWMAWLRRILQRNAADFVRRYRGTDKRQQRLEVPLAPPPDASSSVRPLDPAAPGPTPSQEVMKLERELMVADALTRLEPDHQEVIVLRNLERLPFDEIAQRMGRSRPAVQMLWMRAVRKLQEEVQHAG